MDPVTLAYLIAVGFFAQLVDGTLGMAYGVTSNSLLLSLGVPPATASASVHAAEVVTTAASGFLHHRAGNVDSYLIKRLLPAGVCGGVLGAYVLTSLPGETLKPYIAGYLLLMGVVVLVRAIREIPAREIRSGLIPLGFSGGFCDAVGGGGWGPIVTATLVARGHEVRRTVGSVNFAEFFVTAAASMVFIATLGLSLWRPIFCIAVGGLLAAPIAPQLAKRIPARPFMGVVGLLIIGLSIRTLVKAF